MLIIIQFRGKSASKVRFFFHTGMEDGQKNSRIPSPRNPAVYKTNLTNRHEKISDVFCKDNDLISICKLWITIFNNYRTNTLTFCTTKAAIVLTDIYTLGLGIVKINFASALYFGYICSHDDKIIFSSTAACTDLLQRCGAHTL